MRVVSRSTNTTEYEIYTFSVSVCLCCVQISSQSVQMLAFIQHMNSSPTEEKRFPFLFSFNGCNVLQ